MLELFLLITFMILGSIVFFTIKANIKKEAPERIDTSESVEPFEDLSEEIMSAFIEYRLSRRNKGSPKE